MNPTWIDGNAALDDVVERVRVEPRYALDTEFHGERSYWPRLALVQIAWSDGLALVDPLAVDARRLAPLLAGPGVMVAHAAEQDLTILERACGTTPGQLFDTQVTAGFLGLGTPSLVALVEKVLGIRLGKGDRLTDWTRRPLRAEQQQYAAADVEHLLRLQDELVTRLEAVGRLDWALDECEDRRRRVRARPEPDVAWWRIKGARQLRGRARGVAQEVAAWRERTAADLDVPPRYVLSELALAGIVQRPPRTRDELAGIRGVDNRASKDGTANAIVTAVHAGLALGQEQLRLPEPDRIDRSLAPAVTVIGAWLTQRAGELDLEPAVLATRADLTQFLQGNPSRLAEGWHAELVGAPLRRLINGDASLGLTDGGRRIELLDERRTNLRTEQAMARFRVGVQLHPQATTVDDMRTAWRSADALGADSIWVWDHFYPLYGDPNAAHFEAYTLLAAMAAETEQADIGALVTCNSYRNPNLLADMARTIDHVSGGRFVLGIGAGWFERDYEEYGYEFGTAPGRLRDLGAALPVIMSRLDALEPPPRGRLPILIGGSGEKVTLRLVAEHADTWNAFGPPDNYRRKNEILNDWCRRLERDPRQVERTVAINPAEVDEWEAYVDTGAEHFIVMTGPPYDLDPVARLVESARA